MVTEPTAFSSHAKQEICWPAWQVKSSMAVALVRVRPSLAGLEEITRRLVEYYQPLKVYLFGSTARGEGGRGSDLDFCLAYHGGARNSASVPPGKPSAAEAMP